MNPENDFIHVNSSPITLVTSKSMPIITNGNKETNCSCGTHCKGLRGLKAHQHSCQIIQGLSQNVMKDVGENNGGDVDESMLGDLGNNKCTLSSSVFFECDNESMKKGVKVPKSP